MGRCGGGFRFCMNTVMKRCHALKYTVVQGVRIDGVFYLYVVTEESGVEHRFRLKYDLWHFIRERYKNLA